MKILHPSYLLHHWYLVEELLLLSRHSSSAPYSPALEIPDSGKSMWDEKGVISYSNDSPDHKKYERGTTRRNKKPATRSGVFRKPPIVNKMTDLHTKVAASGQAGTVMSPSGPEGCASTTSLVSILQKKARGNSTINTNTPMLTKRSKSGTQ